MCIGVIICWPQPVSMAYVCVVLRGHSPIILRLALVPISRLCLLLSMQDGHLNRPAYTVFSCHH